MSDPVTQAEIEDVLSSIRRLVSEDGRVTPPVAPVKESRQAAPRLVLTPSLRVAAEPAQTQEARPVENQPVFEQATAAPAGAVDARQPEGTPENRDAMARDPEGWDPEGWDAEAGGDVTDHGTQMSPHQAEMEGTEPAAEADSEAGLDLAAVTELAEALQDEGSDLSSEVGAEAAPWHDPAATLYEAAASGDAPVREDTAPFEPEEPQGGVTQEVEDAGENGQRVSSVVQKIAELEAKVARAEGQWEPDGSSSDPYAGTNIETLEWKDHVEEALAEDEMPLETGAPQENDADLADAELEARQLAEEAALDETLDAVEGLASDESYLDEESLRELVADIVRSELQGALGERITRNVRKLVRREIQRALAAQDLI
ncbi:hypothetical protein [Pseudophaeobacter sp.]|uniref:hypothetical protein n=1 Tax=Pseudophaeobacter sp. TaxID=1971739 RepID=UPI004059C183